MSKNENMERNFLGISQLSVRSLVIGSIGSAIITASSMYTALRMSALPWPTIFVAVLSMALLRLLGKTTHNEINITQTAMSAGAMVAGGLAFTLPGLWISGIWKGENLLQQHFWKVFAIALSGMILGTLLTWLIRPRFIQQEALPYPIGAAAAETIKVGDEGGKKTYVLFGTMALSAIFTYLRDSIAIIPGALTSKFLYSKNFFVGMWLSPMAVGIGYIIGVLYTGVWFLGAILAYLLIIPLGTKLGIFESVQIAVQFKNTAGIGLMVGTGVGVILQFIWKFVKNYSKRDVAVNKATNDIINNTNRNTRNIKNNKSLKIALPVFISLILTVIAGIPVFPSILLMAGVFGASAMAATITGETSINPMEIFGIIVLLAIRLITSVDSTGAFFITACVAVACGYAGDLLNDYKAGEILGTNPTAQLVSQIVGGLVGTVVAAVAMFAIISQFGGVGPDKGLPAAQAFAVKEMVNGIGSPNVFVIALLLGVILYLLKIPAMTLGIGLYLPFEISSIVFLGGLIRFITDKFKPKSSETGNVAASGLLGGEGITGVAIAIIKMLSHG